MRTKMSHEAKLSVLAGLDGFVGRSPEELDALVAVAEDLVVAPGSVLVHEARGDDRWHVVVSGEASLSAGGSLIGSAGPGSVLRSNGATVTAVTLMHLLVLPADVVRRSEEEQG